MNTGATGRRRVVFWGAAAGLGLLGCGGDRREARLAPEVPRTGDAEDIAPAEDLMREHGVLNRLLLVYEECARRIEAAPDSPGPALGALAEAADLVRTFVEDYHEKLEEELVFPRFERAGKHSALVETLKRQHHAGRALTEQIRSVGSLLTASRAVGASLSAMLTASHPAFSMLGAGPDRDLSRTLLEAIRAFARMYRPHEAREDTELFPALHAIATPAELDLLGERFEDRERELFGKEGFERIVDRVSRLEEGLGIHDLDLFTPPVVPP